MRASVVVWALEGEPPDAGEVLLWDSYADGSRMQSVPRYLEAHARRLRSRYLEFIHDLGERRINGKSVAEHLDLGDGFSFWWMTRLAEKSPFKSPQLYDCLRLMALEEMLCQLGPQRLVLHFQQRDLAEAVEVMCRNLGIDFVRHYARPKKRKWSPRDIYLALPYPVQGLISLRHVMMKWPLRRLERPHWFSDRKAIFLCSYFFNLDFASCSKGVFHSNQWGAMPAYLNQSARHANWIHHFLPSPDDGASQARLEWLNLFNSDSLNQGCHSLLESYLSLGVVGRALWKWLRLSAISLPLQNLRGLFKPKDSAASLWPLLRTDWRASLRGPTALSNCLWVELFDAALKDIPRQSTGLYLWENQSWECALLRAWRRHGHGRIIGVPHATVVFWHLNNFDDPRTLTSISGCRKPMPDQLAVNGPMAWRAFEEAGNVLASRFVEVEALRFQYLAEPGFAAPGTGGCNRHGGGVPADRKRRILILGDFTAKQTLKMLSCMEEALRLSGADVSLMFKPHPVSRVRQGDYPSLPFETTSSALSEILPICDLVFSSNTTSAGLEALLARLPVLVFLDDEDFNHSPMRGVEGVRFVGTARELAAALDAVRCSAPAPAPGEFFWLDREMPRWSKVLATECGG